MLESRNTVEVGREAQTVNGYRVILSDNVEISNVGEYFIRGMIVDELNKKMDNTDDEYIFCGEKMKLAGRD